MPRPLNLQRRPQPHVVARTDYARPAGTRVRYGTAAASSPTSLAAGDAMTDSLWPSFAGGVHHGRDLPSAAWSACADITDGASNTYLAGEKYHRPRPLYRRTSIATTDLGIRLGCDNVSAGAACSRGHPRNGIAT